MKKNISIILILVILMNILILSGCQEEQKATQTGEGKPEIVLDSKVVELVDSSTEWNKKMILDQDLGKRVEVVESIEVKFFFHNKVNRDISIKVDCEFYDKNDNLIGIEQGAKRINLPKGYTEKATNTPTNIVTYNRENVDQISRIVIIAEEL